MNSFLPDFQVSKYTLMKHKTAKFPSDVVSKVF